MQLQALFSVYLNDFIPFASVSSLINHQPDGMADPPLPWRPVIQQAVKLLYSELFVLTRLLFIG